MLKKILFFGMIGIVGGIFDYGSRALLIHYGLDPSPSRGFSYIIGSIVAYYLNSFFTFEGNRSKVEKVKAVTAYVICFLAAVLVDHVVRKLLPGLDYIMTISWVLSQAMATAINFTLQNFWVFRNKGVSHISTR
ncbi:GtrA family protein [Corynebacterium xerosis]|uniref:GtrA family protein n=1 Tax=Corynebacterium xerosis TaxID=1725 RepID=UPI003672F0E1